MTKFTLVTIYVDLEIAQHVRALSAKKKLLCLNSSHRFKQCNARCRIAYNSRRTIFRFATAIFMRYQTG